MKSWLFFISLALLALGRPVGHAQPAELNCFPALVVDLVDVDTSGDGAFDLFCIGELEAVDLLEAPGDFVQYSINRAGEAADPEADRLPLTQADAFAGELAIELWGWDSEGNGTSCESIVFVQDNNCIDPATPQAVFYLSCVSGFPPSDFSVALYVGDSLVSTAVSDNSGTMGFTNLTPGLTYTIKSYNDGSYLSGASTSTFDLILIMKHIMGIQPLGNPYKRIAADVDESGHISMMDLVLLRKHILSIDTDIPLGWRMVESHYVFPEPMHPWLQPFPEEATFEAQLGETTYHSFMPIKKGDVNGVCY